MRMTSELTACKCTSVMSVFITSGKSTIQLMQLTTSAEMAAHDRTYQGHVV